MPCYSAVKEKPVVLSNDTPVEDALKALKKARAEYALVSDVDDVFVGLFSYKSLFEALLPVDVSTNHGSVQLVAAPGVAKRLQKNALVAISNFYVRDVQIVMATTPLWEGVRSLNHSHGTPVVVLEDKSKKPLGYITYETMVAELQRMNES